MLVNNKISFLFIGIALLFSCNKKQYVYEQPSYQPSIDTTVTNKTNFKQETQDNNQSSLLFTIEPAFNYNSAYNEIKEMLDGKAPLNFKRAVFITENAYFDNELDYNVFNNYISSLANIAKLWSENNQLSDYNYPDSLNMKLNGAIFKTLTDTVFDSENNTINIPYKYDFEDCFAEKEWANMFVTKLLVTYKGNCHSLPFLYKLIAEELSVDVWLSFTPNHIYLRNWSKKLGWYNTEMTNAMFPSEAWVMTSGYVSVNSIVSGIYMDTLGLKQSVVICLNDLAKGYLRKVKIPDLEFVLKCCDLGLQHFPNYAELLLLKAETHKKMYQNYVATYGLNVQNSTHPYSEKVKYHISEMNTSYALLAKYDYREIPQEMFLEWIKSLENNKEKYQNKKISDTFKLEN